MVFVVSAVNRKNNKLFRCVRVPAKSKEHAVWIFTRMFPDMDIRSVEQIGEGCD